MNREYKKNLPSVPCEESRIQQVIFNILRNGAQAMQEAETEKLKLGRRMNQNEKI